MKSLHTPDEAARHTQPAESTQSSHPLYFTLRRQTKRALELRVGVRDGHSYRPLATGFRHDGFDFDQILREGDFAIFAQSKTGRVMAYEVVHIRRHEGFAISGRYVEPASSSSALGGMGRPCLDVADTRSGFSKAENDQRLTHQKQKPFPRRQVWERLL